MQHVSLALKFMALLLLLAGTARCQVDDDFVPWSVLVPVRIQSAAGARIEPQDDHSLRVAVPGGEKELQEFEFSTFPDGMTGLLVEAIPDEALPQGGPGHGAQGRFALGELRIATSRRGRRVRPVAIRSATTSPEAGGHRPYHVCDGNYKSQWRPHPSPGDRRTLHLALCEPLSVGSDDVLRVTLDYRKCDPKEVLGHFRFLATADPRPLLGTSDPRGDRWPATQRRINQAIDRGMVALLDQQELDGSWRHHLDGYGCGMTGLAVYTLLHCGLEKDHPALQRALAFIAAHPPAKTYSVATTLMALCSLDAKAHRKRIDALAAQLLDTQRKQGWAYPDHAVDLSNTQYAALALRAAQRAGSRIPKKAWLRLIEQARAFAVADARGDGITGGRRPVGYGYHQGSQATGSMTAGAVGIFAICDEMLQRKHSDATGPKLAGLEWLARNFSETWNPTGDGEGIDGRLYYYLYGLERVGGLMGIDHIGPHDWYRRGALFLVDRQRGDGRWGNQAETSFALLFLSRATGQSTGAAARSLSVVWGEDDPEAPLSLRGSGDAPLAVWISSWGEKTRRAWEWGDEEGQGPRVVAVEYLQLEPLPSGDDPALLLRVEGDPSRPAEQNPFAGQIRFPRSGPYTLMARAHLVVPEAEPGDEDAVDFIDSAPLKVFVRSAFDPVLHEFALDTARNLLRDTMVTATASSEESGWEAARATDGSLAQCWRSEDADGTPSLTLTLARPIRADTLLLSHACNRLEPDEKHVARAKLVRVTVNKRRSHTVIMDPDDGAKTILSFKRVTALRELRLEVLEATPPKENARGVGFAEVELQLRKGPRKRRLPR